MVYGEYKWYNKYNYSIHEILEINLSNNSKYGVPANVLFKSYTPESSFWWLAGKSSIYFDDVPTKLPSM